MYYCSFIATIVLVSYALYGVIAAARGKMAELPLLGKQKREKTKIRINNPKERIYCKSDRFH